MDLSAFDAIEAELDKLTTVAAAVPPQQQQRAAAASVELAALKEELRVAQQARTKAEADSVALKERLLRVAEAVKEERRMHAEELNELTERLRLAEDRGDAVEAKLLETVALVKNMEQRHEIELQEAHASAAQAGTSQANQALAEAQERLKEWADRATAAEQQLIHAQDEAERERSKAAEATQKWQEEQNKSSLILEKFNRLGEVSKTLKSQATALASEKEQLEQQLNAAKQSSQQVDQLQKSLEDLKVKLQTSVNETNEWKKRHEDSETQRQRLTSDIATIKAKLESQAETEAKNGERDSGLSKRIQELETELAESRNALDKEKTRSNQIEDKVNRLIPKLADERKQLQEKVSKLEIDLKQATDNLAESQKLRKTDSVKLQEIQQSFQNISTAKEDLQNKLDKALRRIQELELSTITQQAAPTTKTPESLPSGELTRVQSELAETKDRLRTAESRIRAMTQQLSEAEERYQRALASASSMPSLSPEAGPPPPPGGDDGGPPGPPGPPPPPPPPPPPAPKSSGGLKINRTGQSSNVAAPATPAATQANPQAELLEQLKKGVALKKTSGPLSSDEKAKLAPAPAAAKKGGMLGDMASLSMMASQLALARKQRMAEKGQAEVAGRLGRDRKESVRLDTLLAEIERGN